MPTDIRFTRGYREQRKAAASAVWYREHRRLAAARRGKGKFRRQGYYGRFNQGRTQELKFHDLDLDVTLATAGSIKDSLNLIAQGAGESQRLGRKVVIKSIYVRGAYALSQTTADNSSHGIVRCIIYVDRQCNGATAAVLDILETADFQSHRDLTQTQRFKILMDKSQALNKPGGAGNGTANDWPTVQRLFKFYKRVEVPILFDGATGAITEICCNNIGVLFITDTTNAVPLFFSKIRLRFDG